MKRKADIFALGYLPNSVYFTFQFYNSSYTSTERLHLYTGPLPPTKRQTEEAHHRSSSIPRGQHQRQWSHMSQASQRSGRFYLPEEIKEEEQLWPGILYSYEEDGMPNCMLTFLYLESVLFIIFEQLRNLLVLI